MIERVARPIIIGVAAVLVLSACGGGGRSGSSNPMVEHVALTETTAVPSSSMEPTLHCARPNPGCEAAATDRVVVQSYNASPQRGDIIVFKTPPGAAEKCGAGGTFVKRLIGLPGETVSERAGYVYINDKKLNEPYIQNDRRDFETGTWKVPKGEYFAMGDNRLQSCDSRLWGSIPGANIMGRVVKILRVG
jgi:signal peptidase I